MTSSIKFSIDSPKNQLPELSPVSLPVQPRQGLRIALGAKALSESDILFMSAAHFLAHPRHGNLISAPEAHESAESSFGKTARSAEEVAAYDLAEKVVSWWADSGQHPISYLVPDYPLHDLAISYIPQVIGRTIEPLQ